MILLDYKDRRPIYEQIVEKFEDLIARDILQKDVQLPSVRQLAMELSINPNTIQRAYAELERRGVIYSVKGKGSFIAPNEKLLVLRREELFDTLKGLVNAAKILNVNKEEMLKAITSYYEDGGKRHD